MFKIDPKKKKRFLQDIEIEEISLVTKGANRHTFAIVKAAEKSLDESLKEFMVMVKDETDEVLAKVKDKEGALKAIQEALGILTPYMDVFDDPARKAVKLLAGLAGGAAASGQGGEGYGYPAKDEAKDEGGDEDKKFTDADRLKFYKEHGGDLTQFDLFAHTLLATAKENVRRSDPRRDDGFVFKADEPDGTPDDEGHVEKGESQAMPGQEDESLEGGDEPVDLFPSFTLPVFPRERIIKGRAL